MTIAERATVRRRRGMAAENVLLQEKAERRLEEIIKVKGLADVSNDYDALDRVEDLTMETHFARLYQLADDEDERGAAVKAFMDYEKFDKQHDANHAKHRSHVDGAVVYIKSNNPLFLTDGCGPDGRAA